MRMFVITMDIAVVLTSRKILGVVVAHKQLIRMRELSRSQKRNLYPNMFFNDVHMYLYAYILEAVALVGKSAEIILRY